MRDFRDTLEEELTILRYFEFGFVQPVSTPSDRIIVLAIL